MMLASQEFPYSAASAEDAIRKGHEEYWNNRWNEKDAASRHAFHHAAHIVKSHFDKHGTEGEMGQRRAPAFTGDLVRMRATIYCIPSWPTEIFDRSTPFHAAYNKILKAIGAKEEGLWDGDDED